MSASVLIRGALFRAPEAKTSPRGKSYARATLKVADGNSTEFWSLMAFAEPARDALLELHDGDHLAAQGTLKLDLYQGKISRTVFADEVLPLRKRKRRDTEPTSTTSPSTGASERPFDDQIPF